MACERSDREGSIPFAIGTPTGADVPQLGDRPAPFPQFFRRTLFLSRAAHCRTHTTRHHNQYRLRPRSPSLSLPPKSASYPPHLRPRLAIAHRLLGHQQPGPRSQVPVPRCPLTRIEQVFYYSIKRYRCGSGRAWAARQRPVRLVTGHPNSVLDPGSAERHGRSHRLIDDFLISNPNYFPFPISYFRIPSYHRSRPVSPRDGSTDA